MDSIIQFYLIFRDVCLPIVVMFAIGWGMDRAFRLDLETMVKLNLYVFVPAFIFVHVSQSKMPGQLGYKVILFTLSIICSMALLSAFISWALKFSTQSKKDLQMSTMFYNCGNFGIPLIALAYPNSGP